MSTHREHMLPYIPSNSRNKSSSLGSYSGYGQVGLEAARREYATEDSDNLPGAGSYPPYSPPYTYRRPRGDTLPETLRETSRAQALKALNGGDALYHPHSHLCHSAPILGSTVGIPVVARGVPSHTDSPLIAKHSLAESPQYFFGSTESSGTITRTSSISSLSSLVIGDFHFTRDELEGVQRNASPKVAKSVKSTEQKPELPYESSKDLQSTRKVVSLDGFPYLPVQVMGARPDIYEVNEAEQIEELPHDDREMAGETSDRMETLV